MSSRASLTLMVLGSLIAAPCASRAEDILTPPIEKLLNEGRITEAETQLSLAIFENPTDDRLRIALAITRLIGAVERSMQTMHEYGRGIDFKPIPDSNKASAASIRRMFEVFYADLDRAEHVLAEIKDENVKFTLAFRDIKFDRDGDHKPDDESARWLPFLRQRNPELLSKNPSMKITFDRADVAWLRGYIRLTQASLDLMLALDGREIFSEVAVFVFPSGVKSSGNVSSIMEAGKKIAVWQPARWARARRLMLEVCARSRESWKYIMMETDDDYELLPNPKQTGAFYVPIKQDMIDVWLEMVGQVEGILEGRILQSLPGRENEAFGINVKKLLDSPPKTINLFAFQTETLPPYCEPGQTENRELARRANEVFGANMFSYALWFN